MCHLALRKGRARTGKKVKTYGACGELQPPLEEAAAAFAMEGDAASLLKLVVLNEKVDEGLPALPRTRSPLYSDPDGVVLVKHGVALVGGLDDRLLLSGAHRGEPLAGIQDKRQDAGLSGCADAGDIVG
jgi:hypothetical protein